MARNDLSALPPAQARRVWAWVDRHAAGKHWLWTGPMCRGLPNLEYTADGVYVRRSARHVVWHLAGRPPVHRLHPACGDRRCVNPRHMTDGCHPAGTMPVRPADRVIRGYRAAGRTVKAMMQKTGWNRTTIQRRAALIGVALPPKPFRWTPARDRAVVALHAAGWPPARVARRLGCSTWTLRTRREYLGVTVVHYQCRRSPALAAEYGLPPTLTTRGVQVMVLLTGGPLDTEQIRTAFRYGKRGQGIKWLPPLERGGLLVQVRRVNVPSLWMLSAAAIDMMRSGNGKTPAK